jgi:hypothetical protein
MPLWGLFDSRRVEDIESRLKLPTRKLPEGRELIEPRLFYSEPGGGDPVKVPWPTPLSLRVDILSVSLLERTIDLQVRIDVSSREAYVGILDKRTKKRPFSVNKRGNVSLDDRYKNLSISLITNTHEFRNRVTAFPLRSLVDPGPSDRPPESAAVITLGIRYSATNRYPDDWYAAATSFRMQLPDGLIWSTPYLTSSEIPADVQIADTSGSTDKMLYLSDSSFLENTDEDPFSANPSISIIVRRPALTQLFVWSMALTPALLLPVILFQLIGERKEDHAPSRTARNVSLELAAAVLAILPLRQVLVPSEVQGLTTVDYLLGAELAAFIGIVVVYYTAHGWSDTA